MSYTLHIASRSVLDTLYSVQKCLIDSLSVLFEVSSLAWLESSGKPMLASGDDTKVLLWKPTTQNLCEFSNAHAYFLPGFNQYELSPMTVSECQQQCCDNPWCTSFDYAYKADGLTHEANTCCQAPQPTPF